MQQTHELLHPQDQGPDDAQKSTQGGGGEERRGARGRDEERSNQEEWVSKEEGEKERDREIIHTLPEALSMMPSSVSGMTSMRRGGGRGTPMRVVVS